MSTAFVFPGQGSQYVGMGRDLAERFPAARHIFAEANEALGFDLMKLCFEGPEDSLKDTSITQPAILTVSVALWQAAREKGLTPQAMAGHSLGEYSALVAAEAMDFADAVRLVHKRGQYMQQCAPPGGGMAAVLGLENDKAGQACREAQTAGIVEVANYNCPGQVVIAGEQAALAKAMELCKGYGAKRAIPLQVSGPFHSSLMVEAGRKLAEELQNVKISRPVYQLVSNVTAKPVEEPAEIKTLLEKQVSSSVRWQESVQLLASTGIDTLVEIGPGKVLTGLNRKIIKDARCLNIEDFPSLENTLDNLREV